MHKSLHESRLCEHAFVKKTTLLSKAIEVFDSKRRVGIGLARVKEERRIDDVVVLLQHLLKLTKVFAESLFYLAEADVLIEALE